MLACVFSIPCKVIVKNPYIFLPCLSQVTASPLARLSWRGLALQEGRRQRCRPVRMGAALRGWRDHPDLPHPADLSPGAQSTRQEWFGSGAACQCQKVLGVMNLVRGTWEICLP